MQVINLDKVDHRKPLKQVFQHNNCINFTFKSFVFATTVTAGVNQLVTIAYNPSVGTFICNFTTGSAPNTTKYCSLKYGHSSNCHNDSQVVEGHSITDIVTVKLDSVLKSGQSYCYLVLASYGNLTLTIKGLFYSGYDLSLHDCVLCTVKMI